jgi:hypothetical protein
MPEAIADKSMAVPSCLPKTTYALPSLFESSLTPIIKSSKASDYSGYSVSSAGDVNGDGLDDLIVGASYADPSGKPGAGKSYIVFGKADSSQTSQWQCRLVCQRPHTLCLPYLNHH